MIRSCVAILTRYRLWTVMKLGVRHEEGNHYIGKQRNILWRQIFQLNFPLVSLMTTLFKYVDRLILENRDQEEGSGIYSKRNTD